MNLTARETITKTGEHQSHDHSTATEMWATGPAESAKPMATLLKMNASIPMTMNVIASPSD